MYLDLPQALFVTSAAAAFLRWYETSQWAWMAASGWIGGVAVGNKVAAIATLIVFPIITAALACRQVFRRAGWKFEGIETPMVWFNPQATELPHGLQLHVKEVTPAANALGRVLLTMFGQANVPDGHQDVAFEGQIIELNIWPSVASR